MKTMLAPLIASLFATLLTVSAFASNEHHPTPPPNKPMPLIVGQWRSDNPIYSGHVWIHTQFNFTRHDMTLHATCEFRAPNVHLTVGVNSRTAYNGNLIYVYDRVEASTNDGYRYCNAGLSPATWEFYFTAGDINHAVIFAPVPYQMRFNVTRVIEESIK